MNEVKFEEKISDTTYTWTTRWKNQYPQRRNSRIRQERCILSVLKIEKKVIALIRRIQESV